MDSEEIARRLRDYAMEFATVVRASPLPSREVLLNGRDGKHGLNHLNELVQMVSYSNKAEFVVRE